jgi:hypothetical protein
MGEGLMSRMWEKISGKKKDEGVGFRASGPTEFFPQRKNPANLTDKDKQTLQSFTGKPIPTEESGQFGPRPVVREISNTQKDLDSLDNLQGR